MPGPLPKAPGTRQRRNKTQGASLETKEPVITETPPLGTPPDPEKPWHPRTVEWWDQVWSSPMAQEYVHADIDGLLGMATLVDQFWHAPDVKLAAELRLQRQAYGLTPLDRRRLQWEVVRAVVAQRRTQGPEKPKAGAEDPRGALGPVRLVAS